MTTSVNEDAICCPRRTPEVAHGISAQRRASGVRSLGGAADLQLGAEIPQRGYVRVPVPTLGASYLALAIAARGGRF
jgi:hypothetical protein